VIKNNVCWTLFFLINLLHEIIFRAENVLTLKKFSKPKVKRLGKESQVLKEKDLIKCMSSSACVPQVLCTFADHMYAGILLNTRLACPLSSILSSPFSESAAQFCAASVVTALEDLHKVLYLKLNLLSFFFD
jgi:hypothetical protein